MNRRQALKFTTLGWGALYLSAACKAQNNFLNQEKLGVALVGLGNYATRQLGPALKHTQFCSLKGIVTGTPSKAEKWAKEYGISTDHIYNYDSFDNLVNDPAIDIVYIVLPNFMHAEYTIRAFEAGKHVICEKPMGMDASECKQMLAAQKKANKKLQIGYRLYYEPNHLLVKNTGSNQELGKVKMMESSLGFRMATPGSWRMDKDKGGGGAIMDLGVYCIQAARRFTGELPIYISAQGINTDPSLFKGIFETVCMQLYFSSGAICNITTSFNAFVDRFHAACERGWIGLTPAFNAGQKPTLQTGTSIEAIPAQYDYQQVAQMDAFALNILKDTEVDASGEEGLIDLQIIDALKQSLSSGQKVTIDYS